MHASPRRYESIEAVRDGSAMIASQILEPANSHVVQDTATNCTKKLSHAVIKSTV
jgi:hypothetical protein